MCHHACFDPHHFNIISPNLPPLQLVSNHEGIHTLSDSMGNTNIPTRSPSSTSDDESPVSIILLSVFVLSLVSHVPRLQHCELIKNT